MLSRWSNLLFVLLVAGLAEASLAQVSQAQVNASNEAEKSAQPVVIEQPAVIDQPVVLDPALTESPSTRLDQPQESIVIPAGEAMPTEVEEAANSDAIAPPILEAPPTSSPAPESEIETNESIANPPTDEALPAPLDAEVLEAEAPERIYFVNQQVSFIPPAGFTAMNAAEIKAKFPRDMPPKFVYANEARDVSVGVTVSEIPLDPQQLPEVKTVLEDFLETSVPGFQWLEHDFVNLGGQDWIKLEFISQTQDQRIHNDMYITSLGGKLLGFNFNANLAVDFALRDMLKTSRNSILLDRTIASED